MAAAISRLISSALSATPSMIARFAASIVSLLETVPAVASLHGRQHLVAGGAHARRHRRKAGLRAFRRRRPLPNSNAALAIFSTAKAAPIPAPIFPSVEPKNIAQPADGIAQVAGRFFQVAQVHLHLARWPKMSRPLAVIEMIRLAFPAMLYSDTR